MTGDEYSADEQLASVLSEFARTLLTDFPIQQILDHLVRRVVDILPIDAAGVSLISPTILPRLVAGSDESAARHEHLQSAIGDTPCKTAYETGRPISIPNLAEDDRYPRYAELAAADGLAAVFTFPLRHNGQPLGALDLYRSTPGDLDLHDMATAQTLADVTTSYLLNAQARHDKTDLLASVSHELVSNLLSNAMKYTKDGGRVRCTLRSLDDLASLEVSDNGLGIPEAEQPDLFTRFFRSTTAHEEGIQGTGLGLTVVDAIVKSHRGDISVDSQHLSGSTFTVNLPLLDTATTQDPSDHTSAK